MNELIAYKNQGIFLTFTHKRERIYTIDARFYENYR